MSTSLVKSVAVAAIPVALGAVVLVCAAPVVAAGAVAVGCTAATAAVIGGVAASAAGGALIGGGISAGIGTFKQCRSEKEFSYKKLAADFGIGALGGAITGGAGGVGGVL